VSGSRTRFWRVAATSFTGILVAESGDLTQIFTAGLVARYHDPVAVGIGSVLASDITRAAAAAMLILAGASLAAAIW
jgi:putative Ca2+/H+ antiporter (TMEM165/GDT1 family)